jgi:nucleoside-diphosphate-sugar epimerase
MSRASPVVITGGAGFVGLNLAEQLRARGRRVVLFDVGSPPRGTLEELRALREHGAGTGGVEHVTGDVRDEQLLTDVLRRHGAEQLIHGAAITAGREREKTQAARIAYVNVLGTIAALEAARRAGVRRVLVLGTGSVYGASAFAGDELDEGRHLPAPESMYGITKFAAERIALRYRRLWDLDVVVARLAMVFGRWEYDSGVRDTLSLALVATEIAERGGEVVLPAQRFDDWIYGPDVAAALVSLLDAPALHHDTYHVATGQRWTLEDWCAGLRRVFPRFTFRTADTESQATIGRAWSSGRAPFNTRRLREDTGFEPAFTLERALEDFVAWRRAHPAWRAAG